MKARGGWRTFDALIVALGGVDATRGVPGVVEHAFPFKSVDECRRIAQRLAMLDERDETSDVVIIGGGLEGVEALGEILRRYRESRLRVRLVEARERLLPEAPETLDETLALLTAEARPGDTVVLMSNGTFGGLHDRLLLALTERVLTRKAS